MGCAERPRKSRRVNVLTGAERREMEEVLGIPWGQQTQRARDLQLRQQPRTKPAFRLGRDSPVPYLALSLKIWRAKIGQCLWLPKATPRFSNNPGSRAAPLPRG